MLPFPPFGQLFWRSVPLPYSSNGTLGDDGRGVALTDRNGMVWIMCIDQRRFSLHGSTIEDDDDKRL